jgi:YD repeat-containing protein
VRGNQTDITFTQPGGGPVTATTSTNHLGWVTTTNVDPAWGATTAVVDPNGKRTDVTYDGLGRVTGVWYPGQDKASGEVASITATYAVRNNGPTVITTNDLNASGGYTTQHAFFDAHQRVAVPLGLEAGGSDAGGYFRLRWGLRVRVRGDWFVGVYPLNPTFLGNDTSAAELPHWSFPTGLEAGIAF